MADLGGRLTLLSHMSRSVPHFTVGQQEPHGKVDFLGRGAILYELKSFKCKSLMRGESLHA